MFYFEVFNAFYDDMISMKKASNRPKDLSDLAMLKEAHKIMEQSSDYYPVAATVLKTLKGNDKAKQLYQQFTAAADAGNKRYPEQIGDIHAKSYRMGGFFPPLTTP